MGKQTGKNNNKHNQEIAPPALFKKAIGLFQSGELADALATFDVIIALKPDFAEAHSNRGIVLQMLGRYEEALVSFNKSTEINPAYPNAYYNSGVVLQELGRYEEALSCFDKAIAVKADYSSAYNNRGSALQVLGRYEEALVAHDQAISLNPANVNAQWNKSILLLLMGRYEEGWSLYELRWRLKEYLPLARDFGKPLWLGNVDIRNKKILIYHEQGLGDTLLMLRYVSLLAAQGAEIILEVPASLHALAREIPGVSCVVAKGDFFPDFDLQCPFMSLPLAFKTKVESIPANVPYLKAPAAKLNLWKSRLGDKIRPRIGLVWSSGVVRQIDRRRSIPLDMMLPLLENNAEFHSLQIEYRDGDRQIIMNDQRLHDHAAEILDFGDTAALIEQMDMVISVDTAVAHLAGALGKPLWILLPYAADFRWLQKRKDSPWFPTARLFRQTAPDDWEEVLAKINNLQKQEIFR